MTLPAGFLDRPFAHRALHGSAGAENSMAAIKAAIDGGWGIEVDVQLSRDGAAMVFHDYALTRLTGEPGPIQQRDAGDLAHVALLGGGGTIPTLPQVLDVVAGRVPLLIEVKDQDGAMGPNVGALEQAVAQALDHYNGDVAVMSFNPHAVAAFGKAAPNVPRGLVTSAYDPANWAPLPTKVCDRLRPIPDFDDVGADFISHEVADLSSPRVAELKAQGVPILCWTVRSPEQAAEAYKVADQITFEGFTPA